VVGLKGVEYMDSLQDKKRLRESGESISFTDELDRIYLQTPDVLEVGQPHLRCIQMLILCIHFFPAQAISESITVHLCALLIIRKGVAT